MTAATIDLRRRRSVYRRRRLVAAAVIAGVLAIVRPAAGAIAGGATPTPHRVLVMTYVVRSGDSLWTAAEALAPGRDPRPVVQALSQARHGRTLVPGEVLRWTP